MTDTTEALVNAMNALIALLGDEQILKDVAGIDACMDLGSYEKDPSPITEHDMARSAEEFIDDVRISKLPESPELLAAEEALREYLVDLYG